MPRMRARRAVTPLALLLLLPFCATIDRGRDRTVVSVDAEYARAGRRTFGCEGEVTGEQRHNQVGARAAVRQEWRGGAVLGAAASGVAGSLAEHRLLESHRFERYSLVDVGMLAGMDFESSGGHLGVRGIASSRGGFIAAPDVAFWFGEWDGTRLELGSGSFDGPHDARILWMGGSYRDPSSGMSAGVGVAFFGRPLVDVETGELVIGTWSEGSDLGGYGNLAVEIFEGVRLDLGVGVAEFPSGRLGFSFDL